MMMKGRLFLIAFGVLALCAFQSHASVFSGSGGGSLQNVFNSLGYDYIDVANYQTDLNFRLQGMMEFQLMSRSGVTDLSFGVLESRSRRWGTYYRHKKVFGRGAEEGATRMYAANDDNTSYGFFISKKVGRRTTRYYSFSPFNTNGAVQALFYRDPMDSNSYLMAWNGLYAGSSHADQSYDHLVIRMTVHAAPEPATWLLLASGLLGLTVLYSARRKQRLLS
jgi:hypothetical protein